jgi:hypothetical protein
MVLATSPEIPLHDHYRQKVDRQIITASNFIM